MHRRRGRLARGRPRPEAGADRRLPVAAPGHADPRVPRRGARRVGRQPARPEPRRHARRTPRSSIPSSGATTPISSSRAAPPTSTGSVAFATPASPASSSGRPSSPEPSTSHAPWRPPHDPPTVPSALAVAVLAIAVALLAACTGGGVQPDGRAGDRGPVRRAARRTDAASPPRAYPDGCPTAQPAALAADDVRNVTIKTDKGDIVVEIKGVAVADRDRQLRGARRVRLLRRRRVPPDRARASSSRAATACTAARPTWIRARSGPAARRTRSRMSRSPRPTAAAPWRWPAPRRPTPSARSSSSSSTTRRASRSRSRTRTRSSGRSRPGMEAVDAIAAAADEEIPTNPVPMTSVTVATVTPYPTRAGDRP